MATALSSLRVTSDFDASGYVRGSAQKVAADAQMIASDKARNASLALVDAAMAKMVPGMASVSKSLLDGYSSGAQFASVITRIGNAADKGMGLDRINLLLDAAYQKFGLTADAAMLAEKGYVSIAGAVGELNSRYAQLELASASAAAAMARATTQSGINQSFGIGVDPAKSAQESADAFLAQYGGLEGIASQKAKEAGAAFSTDLDASLIAGTTKSARDSANVFDNELSKLDAIATLRAQQAGSNFQSSLTEALGGGGPSATSQGATYSALAEQVQQLDQIEQARASHLAVSTQQAIAEAYAFGQVTNSAKDSAAVFMEAAAAEESLSSKAATLRAQIDPLGAEFGRLGAQMAEYKGLLDAGVISTQEYEQAQTILASRLGNVQQSLKTAGSAGRVMSGELVNLSYQVNDVITGLLLGQPVFMIFAQQGGQIFQIFQTAQGSVTDFAKAIGSKFLDLLTTSRLVWGGIAGAVGLGTAALLSYESEQSKIALGLTGAGRASGSTTGSINAIGQAGSSSKGLSVNEATQLATALATTGKVANDNILPIVQMGKDIGRAFGVDAADAAKLLANAFSDPIKGADDLNQRLGFLDGATRQNISNLVAQNNLYGAQQALIAAVKTSLGDVALTATANQTIWTGLGNAISNAYNSLGKYLATNFMAGNSLDAQLSRAKQNLEDLKSQVAAANDTNIGSGLGYENIIPDSSTIAAAQTRVDALTAAIKRQATATKDAQEAQQSLVQAQTIRSALPIVGQTQDTQNQLTLLQNLANAPDVNDRLAKTGQTMDQLQRAIAATSASLALIPKTALVDFLGAAASPAEKLAVQLDQITIKAAQIGASEADIGRAIAAANLESSLGTISARNAALGASAAVLDIVKQRELELAKAQLSGASLSDTQIADQVDLAKQQALGTLQIKAQSDSITIQAATIGMSAGAAAEYTARMNLLTEAARNHKVLTDSDVASINAQAKALGDAAAKAAQIQAVQTAIPQVAQNTTLQNQLKDLQTLAGASDADDRLAKVGMTMDQLQRAIIATSAAISALPKTALVDFLGAAATPAERLAAGLDAITQKAAQIGATPAQTGRAQSALNLDISSSVQAARMSALGASASSTDVLRQKELDLQRAQQAGAGLTKQQIADQKELAVAQSNGTLQIKAQVDSTNIQAATIGMAVGAAAEYTARMNLLAEAARNHKTLTDSDIESINAQAKALGLATQAAAVKQVNNDISFGRQTALLSPDDVQIAQQLKGIYPNVAEALGSVQAKALETNQALSAMSSTISNDLVTGLSDIVDGTKPVGQGFADMSKTVIRAIEEMLIKIAVVTPAMRLLQSVSGSFFGGVPTPVGVPGTAGSNLFGPVAPNALGGVYRSPSLSAYSSTIVSRPTLFKFANGAGLMGEAGEEAIMPLRRGSDGKLGVRVTGAGGSGGSSTSISFGDINIAIPQGTDTTNAANIAATVKPMIAQVVDDRLRYHTRQRGMLSNAA